MSGRLAVRVTALAFAAAFVFTTIAALASKDVGDLDIIVRKKPGNAIVAHGITGRTGSVDLGNLPAGQYELIVAPPKGAPAAAQIKTAELKISGATAPVKASWNFETGRPFNPAASSTARAAVQNSVPFATDGQHHVVVVVSASTVPNATPTPTVLPTKAAQASAVNTSRSNIKNNLQLNATPSPNPTPRK